MRLVIDLQGAQASNHDRGIGRYARELAWAMVCDCRAHEVILALNGAFPDTADGLSNRFLRALPRRQIRVWEGPRGLTGQPRLRHAAERIRAQFLAGLAPDMVHVSSMMEGEGDDAVTRHPPDLERLARVATCYDLIPLIRREAYFPPAEAGGERERWYFRALHELSLCDGLLAISASSRREAIEHLAVPPSDVFAVGAGVAPGFASQPLDPAAREALLARYGLRAGFVLFVGAGERRKNEAGLVAAYALLPAALRQRHQLVIVGKMPAAALAAQADALGIAARDLRIVAFVAEPDLRALYAACALFVFPSLHEGFGLPAAEAMACGAAVVASNTTSLPEVVGRPDALFDPHTPADIARVMRRALDDAAFRDDLAAHGARRAADLTWTRCAARAWDAIETLHARRAPPLPRTPRVLRRRASLAFVAPLPPQRSGIATYARDLVAALARHYDVTLVSARPTEDARLASAFPQATLAEFAGRWAAFDRVLYHVGNSDRHRCEIESLIEAAPGVVVMHDAFISDFRMWLAHVRGSPLSLRNELYRSDGYPALWDEATFGADAAIGRYTTALHLLRHAVGVIQHSAHGAALLAPAFGADAAERIAVIALLRAPRPLPERAAARARLGVDPAAFVACSFGLVHENKLPHRLVAAWTAARRPDVSDRLAPDRLEPDRLAPDRLAPDRLAPDRLVFVGEAPPELARSLCAAAADIAVTGWVDETTYGLWLAAADMAVQLRERSRGETSAAMYDALAAGLALVVNSEGAAGELASDIVRAIPGRFTDRELADAIAALRDDLALRGNLGAAAQAYAADRLAPRRIAAEYHDAIERFHAGGAMAARCALLRDLAATAAVPPGALSSFRLPAPRQLLIAVPDNPEGWPGALDDVARGLLRGRLEGTRVELIRVEGDGIVYARRAATDLLGLGYMVIADEAIDAGHGDVLLCLGGEAARGPGALAAISQAQRAGVSLVVVACGPPAEADAALLGRADGVLCLSEAAADAVEAWLTAASPPRQRSLSLGWVEPSATGPAPDRSSRDPGDRDSGDRNSGDRDFGYRDWGEQIGRMVLREAWQRSWSPAR